MLIRKSSDIPSSEITSKSVYEAYQRDRRSFLKQAGLAAGGWPRRRCSRSMRGR